MADTWTSNLPVVFSISLYRIGGSRLEPFQIILCNNLINQCQDWKNEAIPHFIKSRFLSNSQFLFFVTHLLFNAHVDISYLYVFDTFLLALKNHSFSRLHYWTVCTSRELSISTLVRSNGKYLIIFELVKSANFNVMNSRNIGDHVAATKISELLKANFLSDAVQVTRLQRKGILRGASIQN